MWKCECGSASGDVRVWICVSVDMCKCGCVSVLNKFLKKISEKLYTYRKLVITNW